jgi:hypothetical protein
LDKLKERLREQEKESSLDELEKDLKAIEKPKQPQKNRKRTIK